MSIRDAQQVLMVTPDVNCTSDVIRTSEMEYDELAWYLSERGLDYCEVGSTLLVPTYRLEEVEEIVEPEKPGVPVEPYVGLTWEGCNGKRRIVLSVNETHYELLAEDSQRVPSWTCVTLAIKDSSWNNYPRTPSTPAVTRKVKKWVKIDHPEVSFDGLA